MSKNIIKVNNITAKKYFLRGTSYLDLEMPEYFNFDVLLNKLDKDLQKIGNWNDVVEKPDNYPDVSYSIYMEKNGHYQWRNYKLLNPFLYVVLVNIITSKDN